MKRNADKLCIIGSAPSKSEAPYSDKAFDVWAISGAVASESRNGNQVPATDDNKWNDVHRVDVYFEMHKLDAHPECVEKLATCKRPVITLKKEKAIPTSEAYPADEVAEALGEEFSSSIAYMMALGIYLGYKEIRLYGVYLMHETEYLSQRPGFKYYLGVARAKGIKVWVQENTFLTCPSRRYGYDDVDQICAVIEARKKRIEADMAAQSKVVEDARAVYFQLRGAAQDCADIIVELKGGIA